MKKGRFPEDASEREYREKENHCSLELNSMERYWEYNSGPEIWLCSNTEPLRYKLLPFRYLISPDSPILGCCAQLITNAVASRRAQWSRPMGTGGSKAGEGWPGTWENKACPAVGPGVSEACVHAWNLPPNFSHLICMWRGRGGERLQSKTRVGCRHWLQLEPCCWRTQVSVTWG